MLYATSYIYTELHIVRLCYLLGKIGRPEEQHPLCDGDRQLL